MTSQLIQLITFAVVTVAFLALAGFLLATSADPSIQKLAVGIVTGLLGLWIQSPIHTFAAQKASAN